MIQRSETVEPNSLSKKKTIKKSVKKTPRIHDVHDIFDGKIRIYRTTFSGDVYQLRMYISEEKSYVRKSLKTREKTEALRRAEEEYIFYRSRIQNGEKIFSLTSSELREKYLVHIKKLVDENQLSKGRESNIKTFTKHYVEFVGKSEKIQNIDRKKFQDYRSFRQGQRKDITMTVVVNETITINQMYKWGKDQGFLSQNYQCDFGKINVRRDEVRRESYTVKEYKQLVGVSKLWYKKVPDTHPNREEEIYYRKSIRDFIVLMGNYGFRTNELRMLKYKDVLVHNDGTATVTIREENTKVRKQREIRGRRGDVFVRRKTYSKFIELDDFVFSHFRQKDMTIPEVMTKELLYNYYNSLIKFVKEKHSDFDDKKTLYCLRHFYITIHLLASKVDVYKIARYCGTSLLQIQKHYDNVKDTQISNEILSYSLKFDKNNEVVLEDDF